MRKKADGPTTATHDVFLIGTAYDEEHNSPWDAVWYDGDDQDLDVLDCELRLGPIWNPPSVRVEKRHLRPDLYVFHSFFAVTAPVQRLLSPLLGDAAEFLPLSADTKTPLFVIHSFLRTELDEHAIATTNTVSGNITVVRRYSFRAIQDHPHIFQIRHPPRSTSRDAGLACSELLVSNELKQLCEKQDLRGIRFLKVFPW